MLFILLVQAGCSSSVLQLRDQPNLHHGTFREKLTDKKELATKFLACTKKAHDEPLSDQPDTGASPEALSLETPEGQATSVRPLSAVIETIRRRNPDEGAFLSLLDTVLNDAVNDATARVDLDKLTQVIETVQRWRGHLALDEDQRGRDLSPFARMLLTYNKAYFGDLSFTASPDLAGSGIRGVVKVTSRGFVDRSGNVLLFPGISEERERSSANSARLSSTGVDSQRVSGDLMRLFLEALFDTAFRVPAVSGATALRVRPDSQEPPYPEFDADHPAISLEALGQVTRDALRAEAVVTSLVGKAVRGGSIFGTQNETLAATLETAAGVMAKKLVEHEGFCYYQVSEGMPPSAAHDQNETGRAAAVTTP
jgi:hypothetical protein